MKDETNIIKYRFLAPIYDLLFRPILAKARRKAFSSLNFQPGDRVLLIGVGTGLDIPFIPRECNVTGIDLSEDMMRKARLRIKERSVELLGMNAENMNFSDRTFDIVVLNLILSVAEHPGDVMGEAVRVLKDGGTMLVFDKFIPESRNPGVARRVLNILTSFAGTDITRRFEDIISGFQQLAVMKDEESLFHGNYRVILLKKIGELKETGLPDR